MVRTVLLSIVSAAALVLLVLGLVEVLSIGTGVLVGLAAVFGLTLGVVTADALRQETSSSHPLPTGRAVAFGASTGVLLAGLAFTAVVIVRLDLAWIILSALLVVAAIGVLSWLGATQTNRHKPWLVEQQRAMRTGNRFEEDPAAPRDSASTPPPSGPSRSSSPSSSASRSAGSGRSSRSSAASS